MSIILSLFITSFSPSTSYAADCKRCDQMTALMKTGDVDQEVGYLSRFKFSASPEVIQMEAEAVTAFALVCMKNDAAGDSREFYYSIYNAQPDAMHAALSRLPAKQQAYLLKVYKETQTLFKNGNGG